MPFYLLAEWRWLAEIPTPATWGASLTYGREDWLYAICGGGRQTFYCYDISENRWYSAPPIPSPVSVGGSVTSNWGVGDDGKMKGAWYIWALCGGNTKNFYQFSLYNGVWEKLADILEPVQNGGALTYAIGEDGYYYVYAIIGGGARKFYRYGPVPKPDVQQVRGIIPPHWEELPPLPLGAEGGASLAWGGQDSIFYNQGGNRKEHYSYHIPTRTWHFSQPLDWTIGNGSNMTSTRGVRGYPNEPPHYRLYVLRGNGEDNCGWRIVREDRWRGMERLPVDVYEGGSIAIGPCVVEGYRIYALVGGNRKHFLDHSWPREEEGGSQSRGITSLPYHLALFPNPFTSEAKISFSLPKPERLSITLYGANGRKVKKIFAGEMPAGGQTLSLERKDESGKELSPGVYFLYLKLKTEEKEVLEKVVIK